LAPRTQFPSVCKIDGATQRSIGHGRLQRVMDSDANFVTPKDMLVSLRDNDRQLGANL
jgi:starvation-inducible DNA-binding protein